MLNCNFTHNDRNDSEETTQEDSGYHYGWCAGASHHKAKFDYNYIDGTGAQFKFKNGNGILGTKDKGYN